MNELPTTATRAERAIWEKLKELETGIRILVNKDLKYSIDEVSLYKASRLIRRSEKILVQAVNNGELDAMQSVDKHGKIRYRFKVADLLQWQEERKSRKVFIDVRTAEDVAKEIFNNKS